MASTAMQRPPLSAISIAVYDRDHRNRAEICWNLTEQAAHVEPYESLAEVGSDWHGADLVLVHDQDDNIANVARWGIEARVPLPIVAYARSAKVNQVVKAIKAGASEYLILPLDASSVGQIFDLAIQESDRIAVLKKRQERAASTIDKLTTREREILVALSNGSTSQQIGATLGISYRTVEVHRYNLRRKLGSISTAEAIKMLVEGGVDIS